MKYNFLFKTAILCDGMLFLTKVFPQKPKHFSKVLS